ncbi:unannotated protein [freshwater metagenome]|uniref:Unannotated protein n=1 Tax=freshwater metagenome TaxID=449393 RepID=A0A6J6MLV7_9ZZZZ
MGSRRHVSGRFYPGAMIIDCDTCVIPTLGRAHECAECVVTHLLSITGVPVASGSLPTPSPEHLAALEVLVDSGLVPPSKHLSATG